MGPFTHSFLAPICRFGVGKDRKIWYRVVFLPPEAERDLPFDTFPRLRVRGEIAGVSIAGAFMPSGDGRRYLIVPPTVCKFAQVDVGSVVEVGFLVDDQDRVDIPDDLARELARNEELKARWEKLTPGRRRGLAHPINAARSTAARERQLLLAIERIME